MRVGVNEMMDEDLLQVDIVEPACDLGAADAGRLDSLEVVDLDAGDVLQRQYAAGRVLPEDIGDVDARVRREIGREPVGVPPFGHKIEFGAGGGRELIVEPIQIDAIADGPIPFQPVDGQVQRGQVGGHQPLDAWALDLHHDFLAILQPRGVHLRQRGGRDRLRRKPGEDVVHRSAELGCDQRPDVFRSLRRHFILEALQLVCHHGRQDIHPDAEKLAQLDQDAAVSYSQSAKAVRVGAPSRHVCPAHITSNTGRTTQD